MKKKWKFTNNGRVGAHDEDCTVISRTVMIDWMSRESNLVLKEKRMGETACSRPYIYINTLLEMEYLSITLCMMIVMMMMMFSHSHRWSMHTCRNYCSFRSCTVVLHWFFLSFRVNTVRLYTVYEHSILVKLIKVTNFFAFFINSKDIH